MKTRMLSIFFAFLTILCFSASADAEGLNCEGLVDEEMHCFENNTVANANEVNKNFSVLLNLLHTLAPIGSIQPYYGNAEPDGWVMCDGRLLTDVSLADSKFENLKDHLQALGHNKLPDLRGMFLRGLNDFNTSEGPRNDGNQDPDGSGRTLGDDQLDQYRMHNHGTNGPGVRRDEPFYSVRTSDGYINVGGTGKVPGCSDGSYSTRCYPNTRSSGGNETRPKNVAVTYLIKY